MEKIFEKMNETINNMIYHSETYFAESLKMDKLIYKYLNINEEDALIESYDDRIEISFKNHNIDDETISKIYKLSKEIDTKINANLNLAIFQLDITKNNKKNLS